MNYSTIKGHIENWRTQVSRHQKLSPEDINQLEEHLIDQVTALTQAGLDDDEAFLIAVKRLGDLGLVSREFLTGYTQKLWNKLAVSQTKSDSSLPVWKEGLIATGLAISSAVAIKVPALLGVNFDQDISFYTRNFSLLILPFLALFFIWKRRLNPANIGWVALPFVLAALAINILPFQPGGHTEALASIHLPLALWLAVGFAYVAGRWRDHEQRLSFISFSGEWFIYLTLIALGGGVLILLTAVIFESIGVNPEVFLSEWLLPCGVGGAVIISAWLVESKQQALENMAPLLTHIFTPLFTAMLLVFIGTVIWTKSLIKIEREVLIAFDLLLVVVLGLLIYSISTRNPQASPDILDRLRLALLICALIVDSLALGAIAARISEFGFTPNKVAALGENIILLANLSWSAVLYTRFLTGRASLGKLQRWQTAYIPVYALWAWFAVIAFPVIFNYQ